MVNQLSKQFHFYLHLGPDLQLVSGTDAYGDTSGLAVCPWLSQISTVYAVNPGGAGYSSFTAPGSSFSQIKRFRANSCYIVILQSAPTTPVSVPGAVEPIVDLTPNTTTTTSTAAPTTTTTTSTTTIAPTTTTTTPVVTTTTTTTIAPTTTSTSTSATTTAAPTTTTSTTAAPTTTSTTTAAPTTTTSTTTVATTTSTTTTAAPTTTTTTTVAPTTTTTSTTTAAPALKFNKASNSQYLVTI